MCSRAKGGVTSFQPLWGKCEGAITHHLACWTVDFLAMPVLPSYAISRLGDRAGVCDWSNEGGGVR